MPSKKPIHVPSKETVATVKIHCHWGNLLKDTIECGAHNEAAQISAAVARMAKETPTPPRNSFVVYHRSYNRAKDTFGAWKPAARYNHLGLEIAL